ncbi:tyrosine-type recombinase/integrase [Mangrovimonas spongiae]|nr:site-specific integrase [Mangrovimonas spongiae]
MRNFNALIEIEYESAYENAYDLSLKKKFSTPKIYTANNDLSKRWYVYFSYRHPETGKLKRQTPIYGEANKYKTKEERLAVLTILRQVLNKLLRQGYSPYEDNTALYNKQQAKQHPLQQEPKTPPPPQPQKHQQEETTAALQQTKAQHPIKQGNAPLTNGAAATKKHAAAEAPKGVSLEKAFDFDAKIKEQTLQASSLRSYGSHIRIFKKWLKTKKKNITHIKQVEKSVVSEFLLHIMTESSPRNRNNYRASLSSFFSTLEEHELVRENMVKKIKVLKTTATRNKTYTVKQQQDIFNHLEKHDPTLLLFIKFVSYNFLRPIEVCRLKVEDIDAKTRTLSFKAKNSPLKTKIIPEILWNDLPDLSKLKKTDYLFTPKGVGGEWPVALDNKRNYFSKRFKKVVKNKFNLGKDHTMYSFRHTYITKLYRALVEDSSPHAAKSKLMQITGHSSMTALEKYLRDIDAELPEDYSELIKN